MALQGTLKDFGLADIFQLIAIQRKTGVLTLRRNQDIATVSFLKGQVVSADAINKRVEHRVGELLVKTGKITPDQLRDALKKQSATLMKLGTILVGGKLITPDDLRSILTIQTTQLIYGLFRWKDGDYEFSQEETIDYDREYLTPIGAETLLMEGARMIDEWPIIERRISSFDMVFHRAARPPVSRKVAVAHAGEEISEEEEAGVALMLSQEEERVLNLVDGTLTVADIVDRSQLGEFETCKILYDLLNRDLLKGGETSKPEVVESVPKRGTPSWPTILGWMIPIIAALSIIAIPWNPLSPMRVGSATNPDDFRLSVSRSRLGRIDFALRVCYLEKQTLPLRLETLVADRFLRPPDLFDPWGAPYGYRLERSRYQLVGTGADGEAPPELTLVNHLTASQRLVIGGGIPASSPDADRADEAPAGDP